jgi:hypothetical protein
MLASAETRCIARMVRSRETLLIGGAEVCLGLFGVLWVGLGYVLRSRSGKPTELPSRA